MTATPDQSVSGLTHVVFYDGSRMPIAELVDELVNILCLEGDFDFVYELEEAASEACDVESRTADLQ